MPETEPSTKRNETDLDSIEVGNSKTGKFKLYFNIRKDTIIEIKNLLTIMADMTRHANDLVVIKE